MPIFVKFIEPQLNVQGPLQQFIYNDTEPLGTTQLFSQFVPIPSMDSNVQFDLINFAYNGYRMGLDTSSLSSAGMWHFSKLTWNNNAEQSNYTITPLITFNQGGNSSFDFQGNTLGGVKDPILLQDVVTLNYLNSHTAVGTVTSVGITGDSNFIILNTPITSSGNINISLIQSPTFSSINTKVLNLTTATPSNYLALKVPSNLTGAQSFIFPTTGGSNGNVLKTDGAGNTSWIVPNSGTVTSVGITSTDQSLSIGTPSTITTSGNINLQVSPNQSLSQLITGSLSVTGTTMKFGTGAAFSTTIGQQTPVTQNVSFLFPKTNGSNSNILSTDGAGNTSWINAGAPTSASYLLTQVNSSLPSAVILPVINTGIYVSNISGSGNLYIGTSAGSNSVAYNNIGIGYQTLDVLANNSNGNIAIGPQALQKAMNSKGNTVIGYQSMSNLSTDSTGTYYNTAIGYQTFNLLSTTTSRGASTNNVALGNQSGSKQNSYSGCTFLGSNTDANQAGLVQATAIGFNTIVKCNAAYAIGSEESNWPVGIGIGAPCYSLHIGNTSSRGGFAPSSCSMVLSNTATIPSTQWLGQYDVCLWAQKGSSNGALFFQSNTGGIYKIDSSSISNPAAESKIPVLTADEIQALTEIALGAMVYDITNDTIIISTSSGWANLTRSEYNPKN